jgi:hypothetical protein
MLVVDGKPDSDTQTHRIAQDARHHRHSHRLLGRRPGAAAPLRPRADDARHSRPRRSIFVLNKATESNAAIDRCARGFIQRAGFRDR